MIKSTHMKSMFVASGVLAASVCFAAAPTDVYLLIGQSNMAGRGELNATNRVDATRVLKWDAAAGEWVAGEEPINQDTDKPLAGLAASFARQMADESPDAVIGLVPAAVGGTQLREWMPGCTFYTNAVARCRAALAKGGTLKGILWHQGCADSWRADFATTYAARLEQMVAQLRADLGAEGVPLVAGEIGRFLDDYVWQGPDGKEIRYTCWRTVNEQIHAAAKRIPKMKVVSSEGLLDRGDVLHFGTPSLRVLGRRYADAMRTFVAPPLRAAWFRRDITPAVGTKLAGYGPNDVSVAKNDALEACGLCLDDGVRKAMLVSLDVLGMDDGNVLAMRKAVAEELGTGPEAVLISCTHTHEGPHTRALRHSLGEEAGGHGGRQSGIDAKALEAIRTALKGAAAELRDARRWREVAVGFHSAAIDENRNRRFTTADNCASFIAHRRTLHGIATGIADKELGTVALLDPKSFEPLYVIGNYAAHPLAAHAPGRGGLRISADFPGFYRRYVTQETGAEAMFVQGAAGDLVPKGDELGLAAARRTGENLAMESIASLIDIQRNAGRFVLESPRVGVSSLRFASPVRAVYRKADGRDSIDYELQLLAIGDVCFVGVPGETVNELGLEFKWHSPFKRTFVAYCSTGYWGYICPANLVAAGGYEPMEQRMRSRDALRMVSLAADAMQELRNRQYPGDAAPDEPYPDCRNLPVLNLPGGYKASKWSSK